MTKNQYLNQVTIKFIINHHNKHIHPIRFSVGDGLNFLKQQLKNPLLDLREIKKQFHHDIMTYKLMTMTISAIFTIFIHFSLHPFYSFQHGISFHFMTIIQQCIIYYHLLMTENRHRHHVDSC